MGLLRSLSQCTDTCWLKEARWKGKEAWLSVAGTGDWEGREEVVTKADQGSGRGEEGRVGGLSMRGMGDLASSTEAGS